MRILGIDPSKRSCGWALWSKEDHLASGTWELGSELTTRGIVFARLHENMMGLHRLGAIDAVFYEDVVNIVPGSVATNKDSIMLAAGIAAHIESFGEAMGFRIIRAVHQATWRRHFIGSFPRATRSAQLKDMAMQRARQLGFKPLKHDQAEAIGIVDWACVALDIMPPWRADEVLRPPLSFNSPKSRG